MDVLTQWKLEEWAGYLVCLLGCLIFLAAVLHWKWIFTGKERVFSLPWWSSRYGRDTARIVAAVLGLGFLFYGASYLYYI